MIPLTQVTATMSSVELVDVINSMRTKGAAELLHKNFLAKVEKHPGITSAKFLAYVDVPGPNGAIRKSKCYILPKRECELMVMSESLQVQAQVYDRLMQKGAVSTLGERGAGCPGAPNFDDPIAMARAWADAKECERLQASRAAQLEHQVEEQAPAVAGFNRIANAEGAMCITDAAKSLQVQPHKLRDVLLEMRWMYRRQGRAGYVAYQDRIHAGHLKHKVGNYTDPETGENKTNAQVLVTSKGLAQLSKLLGPPATLPSNPARSPSRLN